MKECTEFWRFSQAYLRRTEKPVEDMAKREPDAKSPAWQNFLLGSTVCLQETCTLINKFSERRLSTRALQQKGELKLKHIEFRGTKTIRLLSIALDLSRGSALDHKPPCEWHPLQLRGVQPTEVSLFLGLHRITLEMRRKKAIEWNSTPTPNHDLISLPFYYLSTAFGFEKQE